MTVARRDVKIDVQVVMHDPVAHAENLRPGNLRMSLAEVVRNEARRFAHCLDQVNHSEPEYFIWTEEVARRWLTVTHLVRNKDGQTIKALRDLRIAIIGWSPIMLEEYLRLLDASGD